MAHQGRKLTPADIARIRRLTAVCRDTGRRPLSIRKAAREAGVDAKTVQKYVKATASVSGQPASA